VADLVADKSVSEFELVCEATMAARNPDETGKPARFGAE
jgi:hypothetical protein